ncbi:Uncharacterised protein [Mycobacteroides abscessus subsp. massiliense]|nr:Uncharacterised protein [Mycobacteroides abscessus subsp. massiliense]
MRGFQIICFAQQLTLTIHSQDGLFQTIFRIAGLLKRNLLKYIAKFIIRPLLHACFRILQQGAPASVRRLGACSHSSKQNTR